MVCSRYKQAPVISSFVSGDMVVDAFYSDYGIGDTYPILIVSHHPLHSSVDLKFMNTNTRKMTYAHWFQVESVNGSGVDRLREKQIKIEEPGE